MVFLAIQAVGAIAGGIGLVQDPVDNIGMPLSMLEGSPFTDYLMPGVDPAYRGGPAAGCGPVRCGPAPASGAGG